MIKMKSSFCVITLLLLVSSNARAEDTPMKTSALATLEAKNESKVEGRLTFKEDHSELVITGTISGLTPGKHGIHIHEKGDCTASDASSAGDHFNPAHSEHGSPDSQAHHLGDFGNIDADAHGIAKVEIHSHTASLNGSSTIVGRSIVIHQDPDDLQTQPSGKSGKRIACGVIVYS